MAIKIDIFGVIYGVPSEIKPITNAPPGARLRFRFRYDHEAVVFVKTAAGIEKWSMYHHGDHWELAYCLARNVRRAT